MAKELRKMFQEADADEKSPLPKGHEARFSAKLNKELPQKSGVFIFLRNTAAALVILIGITFFFLINTSSVSENITDLPSSEVNQKTFYTLSDLSPEFQKVENFYLTGINLELARLQINDENREFIDGYMARLKELDDEYSLLNKELNEVGPNEQTINALIENLQLRLDLIIHLKNKLNQFNQSKNEQFTNQQA